MIIEQVEGWILIMAQVKLGIVFSIDSVVYSGPSICCLFCMGFLNGQFYIRFRVIALIILFLRRIVKWQVAFGLIRIIGQGFTGIVRVFCFFDLIFTPNLTLRRLALGPLLVFAPGLALMSSEAGLSFFFRNLNLKLKLMIMKPKKTNTSNRIVPGGPMNPSR